jgi:hypothetical protein
LQIRLLTPELSPTAKLPEARFTIAPFKREAGKTLANGVAADRHGVLPDF